MLDEPLGLLPVDLRHLRLLVVLNVRLRPRLPLWSLTLLDLVLAILVELVLQRQQLVHDLVEPLDADALLVLGKQPVDFLDFVVHLLGGGNVSHDLNQAFKVNAAILALVVVVDQFLDFVFGELDLETAEEVLELAGGDGAIAILVKQLEGLPVLLEGAAVLLSARLLPRH